MPSVAVSGPRRRKMKSDSVARLFRFYPWAFRRRVNRELGQLCGR
jgi:hypothetical protein